jgi:glycosyltransferase involved in cell wall biosynthesis
MGQSPLIKRVCIVTQSHYPEDGRVRKEVRALLKKGYMVHVLSLHRAGKKRHEIVDGIEVFRGGLWKKRAGMMRYVLEYIAFFLFSLVQLNILDTRKKIDVVEVCTLPDFLVFSAFVQKMKRRRIVLDMHEIMPEFFMSKFGVGENQFIVKVLLFLEKVSLRFADGVITVNEPIRRIFEKRAIPGRHIEVVMNTVDGSSLSATEKSDHSGFNCVYHGTVTELYGLETAIRGFSLASPYARDMRFHIFGNGVEARSLKTLARDLGVGSKVIFHGFLPHQQMLKWLWEMDLGILALRKDVFLNLSFSNKLAEYIYFKIPVVTSDLDSTKYYFDESQILYYESGNVQDLSSKILFAYRNREKTTEMSEAARVKYEDIDWSVMEERYLKAIDGSGYSVS